MPDQQQALDHRRIDALVAEHVMGWRLVERPFPPGWLEWNDEHGQLQHGGDLSFTSRWDSAGQVVERMIELGFEPSAYYDMGKLARRWDVRFVGDSARGLAFSDMFPLAACLAALRACGVQVDEVTGSECYCWSRESPQFGVARCLIGRRGPQCEKRSRRETASEQL
jgi:hypothetical protein